MVAHIVVGAVATIAAKKMFGTRSNLALAAAFLLPAMLHAKYDAPLAQAMANVGR